MNKALRFLIAGMFSLVSILASAQPVTPAEQAKMDKDSAAAKAAQDKMTPEQKAAAKKARKKKAQSDQDTLIKNTQNPGEARNMSINKSAADSKAGPTPQRDYINTPEAEQKMLKQKGQ
jgi:hypothetical protein